MASSQQQALQLKSEWAGFDLVRVGAQVPVTFWRNDMLLISGCITTVNPMKNQAGWDLTIGYVDPRCSPPREITMLAPTAMSRYEGICQCGTSMTLKPDGKLTIFFNKNTNPMVLHLSGFCCASVRDEPIPIQIAQYNKRDWFSQTSKPKSDVMKAQMDGGPSILEPNEMAPPGLHRCGDIVLLHGELKDAVFGPSAQHVGTLPEGMRPLRELRWLAALLRTEDSARVYEHSVAVTLRPDGSISVQGGKVHIVDSKGHARTVQQNKRGKFCFDGIRFSLVDGTPIELSRHVIDTRKGAKAQHSARDKLSYLVSDSSAPDRTAVCVRQGDVVMLEGYLAWGIGRPPHAKQPIASLPDGCWPRRREVFFTRGGSDLQERRRVDIDQFGRIFCPEGVSDGRVELTGIIFVSAEPSMTVNLKPKDPDWDELRLQYNNTDVSVVSASFDGRELLEQFIRRSNVFEWDLIGYDFARHAQRKMLLPHDPVPLRGHPKGDPMDLGSDRNKHLWTSYSKSLTDNFGINYFYTLLHVSDDMLERIARKVNMRPEDKRYLADLRQRERQRSAAQRQPGLTFRYLEALASEISDQMFEHWDFKAQLQGALENNLSPPATIEHLFPQRKSGQDYYIKKHVKEADMAKFEEIRQFFFLYETTGSNMTHCSLMGSSDVFTTTGKWHFPDSPDVQRQLFENIEWLFPRKIYLYMSERQTLRFPFIEDLDVQAPLDWEGELPPGAQRRPPDMLIMNFPERREGGVVDGDPGELMKHRAMAVHMIYPHIDQLDVLVYSASGHNKGKGMLKSSFHLVWPQLIVDPDLAPVIRKVTLGLFQRETRKTGSFLNRLQTKLLELDNSNNWELVFDSTTINARNGLRLPYNDKASMVVEDEEDKRRIKEGTLSKTKARKKRVREDRPSKAIGKIRFTFDRDPQTGEARLQSSRWVADKDTYKIADWIGMGTCRRDPNTVCELTPWQIGPDVLEMLPYKPGERFTYREGEEDGEGGHCPTHKPFENIRRCDFSVLDFQRSFNEALNDEQDALKEEHSLDLLRRVIGSWVSVTPTQAIWRASVGSQFEGKVPDQVWATGRMLQRPAEVVYVKSKGKVIVDGKPEVCEALLRALETFTKPDDNPVEPIYDLNQMQQ